MRVKKKEIPEKQLEKYPKPARDDADRIMAIVTQSARDAAQSAGETSAIAKIALDNESYEELKEAIVSMADSVNKMALAVENKFTPIRVVPKRDSRGIALSYDILPLTKTKKPH